MLEALGLQQKYKDIFRGLFKTEDVVWCASLNLEH